MKRRERTNKKSRRRPPKQQSKKSIDDLIALADSAMEVMDISQALNLYSSAATQLRSRLDLSNSKQPQHNDDDKEKLLAVLGKLGEAKVSQGDQEGARKDFADAIALLSEQDIDGHDYDTTQLIQKYDTRGGLYLYLGQLSSDHEALDAYKKGVEDFEACLRQREASSTASLTDDKMVEDEDDDDKHAEALQETRRQLCGAYCAVAELYLTDLCFEENAESQCEFFVNQALQLVDSSGDGQPFIDALQALASFRLSQQRADDAARSILQVFRKIEKGCKALSELVGLGPSTKSEANEEEEEEEAAIELVEVDAANNLPGFEFRCQTAKILLECTTVLRKSAGSEAPTSDNQETPNLCVEAAIQVLGSLLAENDEVVEIWYLTGCAFAATYPPNLELATSYWHHAMDMLNKIKEELEDESKQLEGDDDEEADRVQCELQSVAQQIHEVTLKLQQLDDEDDIWDVEEDDNEE